MRRISTIARGCKGLYSQYCINNEWTMKWTSYLNIQLFTDCKHILIIVEFIKAVSTECEDVKNIYMRVVLICWAGRDVLSLWVPGNAMFDRSSWIMYLAEISRSPSSGGGHTFCKNTTRADIDLFVRPGSLSTSNREISRCPQIYSGFSGSFCSMLFVCSYCNI